MPKVSVIVPVYGVEKYIERCACSLFEQTLDDIEYIFIDDCSPDNSIDILKNTLNKYPHRVSQVKIHRMDENSGQAKVREWGMRHARGEFVIHCDSDDWPDVNQYKLLYDKAQQFSADLVFCDYFILSGKKRHLIKNDCVFNNSIDMMLSMIGGNSTPNNLWACLAKRELFDQLEYPAGNQGEDKVIMLQLVYRSKKIAYVNEALYNYVFNTSSITNSVSVLDLINRNRQIQANCNQIEELLKREKIFHLFEKQIVEYKLRAKTILWPQRKVKEIRELWKKTYPEIHRNVIFNKYITLKSKVIYILFKTGLCKYL